MQQLVDLFGFLSVVLRAGTLVFQSLLLGGVLFILWISRNTPGDVEQRQRMESSLWTLLRISILGLIVIQARGRVVGHERRRKNNHGGKQQHPRR